jgi:hypothetical protein
MLVGVRKYESACPAAKPSDIAVTEADTLIAAETSQWYETLTTVERQECAAELTDAYFAALNNGEWDTFRALAHQWHERATSKELVTV